MNEPVVSVDDIEKRAQRDFERGEPCPFPWHSAARKTWERVQARLAAESQAESREVA